MSTYPIPPEYARQQSTAVQKRSNTGANYEEITRHGRGYVCGSLTERSRAWHGPTLPHSATMSADRIRAALETAPITASGYRDAIAIAKLTDVIYPDLPRLIGADTIAYEETQGANVLSQVRALARPPRVTLGKIHRTKVAEGYVRFDHEELSPTDDGRVFVGHAAIIPKRETDRDRRDRESAERESAKRAALEESTKVLRDSWPISTAVSVLATGLIAGSAVPFTHGGTSGTVSRSKSDRYSATVNGQAIRSQRSVKALARKVAELTS